MLLTPYFLKFCLSYCILTFQVFVDNFVHGDLHPGNILVQNAAEFKPEVGYEI